MTQPVMSSNPGAVQQPLNVSASRMLTPRAVEQVISILSGAQQGGSQVVARRLFSESTSSTTGGQVVSPRTSAARILSGFKPQEENQSVARRQLFPLEERVVSRKRTSEATPERSLRRHHKNETFKCNACPALTFTSSTNYAFHHREKHFGKNCECWHIGCINFYTGENAPHSLVKHIREKHGVAFSYECGECVLGENRYSSDRSYSVKSHIYNWHINAVLGAPYLPKDVCDQGTAKGNIITYKLSDLGRRFALYQA